MKHVAGAMSADEPLRIPSDPEQDSADQARERARISHRPARPLGRRQATWSAARSLGRHETPGRPEDEESQPFSLGWKASLLLNLILICGPIGLVIALPPVLECHERGKRFGFFAGDSFETCASDGIGRRLKRLDDRIKMLVRGSGR